MPLPYVTVCGLHKNSMKQSVSMQPWLTYQFIFSSNPVICRLYAHCLPPKIYENTRLLKKWVEIGICLNHCFDSFSQLKEFQGTLIEMFKEVFKSEKNPAWMFCLPLLHLLSGDCTPYEEISEDLSHSHSEPKWWGTCAIKHVVRLFKEKKKKWTM